VLGSYGHSAVRLPSVDSTVAQRSTVCIPPRLFIHPATGIPPGPARWQGQLLCTRLLVHVCTLLPGVRLGGKRSAVAGNARWFSKLALPISHPPAVPEGSSAHQELGLVSLSNVSHSGRCTVVFTVVLICICLTTNEVMRLSSLLHICWWLRHFVSWGTLHQISFSTGLSFLWICMGFHIFQNAALCWLCMFRSLACFSPLKASLIQSSS